MPFYTIGCDKLYYNTSVIDYRDLACQKRNGLTSMM